MPSRQFRSRFSDGMSLYRSNAAGFRSTREFVHEKRPNTKRILVFGDSFTEGSCVNEGERYSELLENTVDAEMYNFAVSGTGTDQQYLTYREIGSKYEHDLVVIGVWIENIRRNAASSRIHSDQSGRYFVISKPYFTLDAQQNLELHNQPVPRQVPVEDMGPAEEIEGVDPGTLARRGVRGLLAGGVNRLGPGPKRLAQRVSRHQPFPEYDSPDSPSWLLTKRILQQWAEESSVPVVVVPIPVYQYIEETAPSVAVRTRFGELHDPPRLHVHDPLPDFWEYPKAYRRQFRYPQDHHFTPAGHAALASSMAPVLRHMLEHGATKQADR